MLCSFSARKYGQHMMVVQASTVLRLSGPDVWHWQPAWRTLDVARC